MKKKVVSLLLAILMVLSTVTVLPITSSAEPELVNCSDCNGTGKCKGCQGNSILMIGCGHCNHDGKCTTCDGTGKVAAPAPTGITTWSALQEAINNAPGDATASATGTTNIKLTEDLTAPATGGATITIPAGKNITLDLCGHVLNANGGKFSVFTIEKSGGTMTVVDSVPTTEHKGYVDANNLWHWDESGTHQCRSGETAKTINGGIITGSTATSGGAFKVKSGSVLTMNGGTIAGNAVTGDGGAVDVSGSFTMTNGVITGNNAKNGGGVSVWDRGSVFTLTGGEIKDNTVTDSGGAVYNYIQVFCPVFVFLFFLCKTDFFP